MPIMFSGLDPRAMVFDQFNTMLKDDTEAIAKRVESYLRRPVWGDANVRQRKGAWHFGPAGGSDRTCGEDGTQGGEDGTRGGAANRVIAET